MAEISCNFFSGWHDAYLQAYTIIYKNKQVGIGGSLIVTTGYIQGGHPWPGSAGNLVSVCMDR